MEKTAGTDETAPTPTTVAAGAVPPHTPASSGPVVARVFPAKEEPVFSTSRRLLLPVVAVLALALAAGTATAAKAKKKPKPKNPIPALVKQSKTESGIVVYGNPPAANFNALVAAFNKTYPWIKVTEYDLDDNTIFSKYASEAAQGARTADMLIASAPNLWVYASRKGYANRSFTPTGLSKYPKWAKQFKGIYIMSPDPAIIVYNKLLVKNAPTSVAQIANDSALGSVTGYTADNTFGYTGLYGYVQIAGWKNLQAIGKRLKPQTGVGAQLQLLAQGGASVAYLTSPTARFTISSNAQYKQILDWTYVKDGTGLVPRGIAVTAHAASPASAKLFLDWMYGNAGQQAMCESGFTAFKTGFKPANGCANTLADVYAKVGAKKVYMPGFTQKFVNARPKFTSQWHGIFG
jgi:iron(III) transport system substrate-binding protein